MGCTTCVSVWLDLTVGYEALVKERRHVDRSWRDRLGFYSGDWTVLLDEGGRIVYELGSFDSIFGGNSGTPSLR